MFLECLQSEILIKEYESKINEDAGWGIRKAEGDKEAHKEGRVGDYNAESPTSTEGEVVNEENTDEKSDNNSGG